MAVEDQRGRKRTVNEDKFPVGMRVLAVDDDPTCLKVLDTFLKKCQYHVTTTNQAVQALKMLRENRNKYDLVISDVNMPDMDGFKLLELVGLEMDLPVIMLSAHSDKELVYKGVTHGAVDYLLKPVRIEELKNIWQHVIRKKKLHPNVPNRSSNHDTPRGEDAGDGGIGQGLTSSDSAEQDENEDPAGSHKKRRLIWSPDLHMKFVTAFKQLGHDNAVPKKILDLMNVEGLTREKVASHLQKYRLGLKKANMAAESGGGNDYMSMGSLDGFRDFRTPLASTSYPPRNMQGTIASSGLLQPQILSNSVNSLGNIQPVLLPPSHHSANVFHSLPLHHLDPNQLQRMSNISQFGEFTHNDRALGSNFSDGRVTIGSLNNNNVSGSSSNPPLLLRVNPQQIPNWPGAFATQSSIDVPSLNHDQSFDGNIHGLSNFMDHSRSNDDDWHV